MALTRKALRALSLPAPDLFLVLTCDSSVAWGLGDSLTWKFSGTGERICILKGRHLHEVHRVGVDGTGLIRVGQPPGVVLLAVQDAGARAHPLGQAGVDHAGVALGILVHQ